MSKSLSDAGRRPSGWRSDPARRVHGDVQGKHTSAWNAVYRLVRRIPRGRVMTYGQIATLLESRLSPRAVGWALHVGPEDVPWHRVVNAFGGCSTDRLPDIPVGLQRAKLEAEGVEFLPNDTVRLDRYRWDPRARPCSRVSKARWRAEGPRSSAATPALD